MMTPRVLKLWVGLKYNKRFLNQMKSIDNEDQLSIWPTSDIVKNIWACWYYGWLVAQYDKNWENHINDKS